MFWVDLTFECYEDVMVFVFSFLFFCLEPTLVKGTWMRATSSTLMLIFLKVLFWKLLDHNYIQSFFSTIVRDIDNSILKDTLQLKNLRTWVKIHANSFIKTWRKHHEMKINESALKMVTLKKYHSVKSVQIRRFFWSVFSAFGLNTERKNSVFGHFSRIVRPCTSKNIPPK